MNPKSKRNATSRKRHNNTNLAYSDVYLSHNEASYPSTPSEPAEPEFEHPAGIPSPNVYSQMSQEVFHHDAPDLLSHEDPEESQHMHLHVAGDPTLSEGPVHVGSPGHLSQPLNTELAVSANALRRQEATEDRIAGHIRAPVLTR